MKTLTKEQKRIINEIRKETGLRYKSAHRRYMRYVNKEISWAEALGTPRAQRKRYDECMVNCIKKETGLCQKTAVIRFKRFMAGELTEAGMFCPGNYGAVDKRLFFSYLNVKYYVKDVARISECTMGQARFKVHKVKNFTMTAKKALEKQPKKKSPFGEMQPRRRIEDIKVGSWEQSQMENMS